MYYVITKDRHPKRVSIHQYLKNVVKEDQDRSFYTLGDGRVCEAVWANNGHLYVVGDVTMDDLLEIKETYEPVF